jgi:hypothetical protein
MRLDVTEPETITLPEGLRVLVNNAGTEADYLPVEAVPMELASRLRDERLRPHRGHPPGRPPHAGRPVVA